MTTQPSLAGFEEGGVPTSISEAAMEYRELSGDLADQGLLFAPVRKRRRALAAWLAEHMAAEVQMQFDFGDGWSVQLAYKVKDIKETTITGHEEPAPYVKLVKPKRA